MLNVVRREFVVDVPLDTAWQHLARVERWPSWAKHIKRVELVPPGTLTPRSQGTFYLSTGLKSTFRMVAWQPGKSWKWVGPFLWLTVHYDHTFTALDSGQTRIGFIVDAGGPGVALFGRLLGAIYDGNLNTAIPLLVAEMQSLPK